jgi:SAM-dependent methyltransferase
VIRRAFRFFFPRRKHPLLDAAITPAAHDELYRAKYLKAIGGERDVFVVNRYEEGCRWREVLSWEPALPGILDIGGGNGAIELAFSANGDFVVSVDALWNQTACDLKVKRVVADASQLPFRAAAFGTILCLETIEHVDKPQRVAGEIARVAADTAILLLTTPPKWRYAFAPDPHFGIRFLTLLPPRWQRRLAEKRGYGEAHHYVDRIYRSTAQLARLFADFSLTDVLSRSRSPRRWFWDALVFERSRRSG